MVVRSLGMLLFFAIEKAATGGCIKIIWRIIRRMEMIYSVGGCYSLTLYSFIVFVYFLMCELLFVLFRFRMSKPLFRRIMNAVEAHDHYFVQKRDAAGVLGLSCFQKVTVALCMLTYGVSADATDEYIRIGESTALESLRKFVAAVVELFEA
jgi:hypothetical protein